MLLILKTASESDQHLRVTEAAVQRPPKPRKPTDKLRRGRPRTVGWRQRESARELAASGRISDEYHASRLALHGCLKIAVHACILLKTNASCPLEASVSFYTVGRADARRNSGKLAAAKEAV